MSAAKIPVGSNLAIGGQAVLTGYIVEQDNRGGRDIDFEDVMAADGSFHTRIVFEKRMDKVNLTLLVTTGNTDTDFPEGALCAVTGLTSYFVDSCVVSNTKSARRAEVQLTKIIL
jgi:hypothetical protein